MSSIQLTLPFHVVLKTANYKPPDIRVRSHHFFLLVDKVTSFNQDVDVALAFSSRQGTFFGTSAKKNRPSPRCVVFWHTETPHRGDCVSVEEK